MDQTGIKEKSKECVVCGEVKELDESLKEASKSGDVSTMMNLIKGDANDDYALQVASRKGYLEVVKYLISVGGNVHAEDDEALRFASTHGHVEVVRELIKAGGDVNAKDDEALVFACTNGYLDVVKELIKGGADVYARDDYA